MRYLIYSGFYAIILMTFLACSETEPDQEKPEININFPEAFPVNCDTLYFGESFSFKAILTDNIELGAYSIGIHNNFDGHSHSTEVSVCTLDDKKEAVNPYSFILDYEIPAGQNSYTTEQAIFIPENNSTGNFDEGDYHFFVSVTDKEGWSVQKGLSIKILRK